MTHPNEIPGDDAPYGYVDDDALDRMREQVDELQEP